MYLVRGGKLREESFFVWLKIKMREYKMVFVWIPVNSTSKVFYSWIRNLKFNPRLHQKPIGILVWW